MGSLSDPSTLFTLRHLASSHHSHLHHYCCPQLLQITDRLLLDLYHARSLSRNPLLPLGVLIIDAQHDPCQDSRRRNHNRNAGVLHRFPPSILNRIRFDRSTRKGRIMVRIATASPTTSAVSANDTISTAHGGCSLQHLGHLQPLFQRRRRSLPGKGPCSVFSLASCHCKSSYVNFS